jgi:penicillin-binding protein 1A
VSGDLAPDETGPVAIQSVEEGDGAVRKNKVLRERVFPAKVGQVAKDMLGLVVSSGTGKAAQVGEEFVWGKTGTTENYGDAWFVGGNEDLTVAIWVGYADKLQPMEFEHAGGPVAGGTYPAEIFQDFMTSWLTMREERRLARGVDDEDSLETAPAVPISPSDVPSSEQVAPTETAPTEAPDENAPEQEAPQQPAPEPEPAPTPAPAPTEPPSGGGGGGGAGPGGTG